MHRLFIVEDNLDHAGILQDMVEAHPRARELRIDHASSPADLEALLADEPVDILVIDIDLGPNEPNGIEVVQRLFPAGSGTQVIYVTGYVEFCVRAYRTDHVYFLAKPVAQSDFNDALDKALANLENLGSSALAVRCGGVVRLVLPSSISYIESDRRKVCIHAGGKDLETYATLSGLAEQLPDSFIQCHKSFLVNMDHIVEFRKDSLVLHSGEIVPISQKKRKATREAFFRRLGQRCG
jgi:DNA-binding LytR/AlgR family response regulator